MKRIMVKKLLAAAGAGAMLLSLAVPAFAWTTWTTQPKTEATVNNSAYVKNFVDTYAGSGGNSVFGLFTKGVIKTGDAFAYTDVANTVNMNMLDCDCYDKLTINNTATVKNYVDTTAKTGKNSVSGSWVHGFIKTGAADAYSLVDNVVNTNMLGVVADAE